MSTHSHNKFVCIYCQCWLLDDSNVFSHVQNIVIKLFELNWVRTPTQLIGSRQWVQFLRMQLSEFWNISCDKFKWDCLLDEMELLVRKIFSYRCAVAWNQWWLCFSFNIMIMTCEILRLKFTLNTNGANFNCLYFLVNYFNIK